MTEQIEKKREQIAHLCRQFHVRRLALFGSALGRDFDPERSDFDFLVQFEELAPGTYAETYFGLMDAMERLLGRKVDLVEEGSIRNPYFQQEIEARQETVYAA